jgi:hypothetical protein
MAVEHDLQDGGDLVIGDEARPSAEVFIFVIFAALGLVLVLFLPNVLGVDARQFEPLGPVELDERSPIVGGRGLEVVKPRTLDLLRGLERHRGHVERDRDREAYWISHGHLAQRRPRPCAMDSPMSERHLGHAPTPPP